MDTEIEAFIAEWMRTNTHLLEEIALLQGDDPRTAYGAAMRAYFEVAAGWTPSRMGRRKLPNHVVDHPGMAADMGSAPCIDGPSISGDPLSIIRQFRRGSETW